MLDKNIVVTPKGKTQNQCGSGGCGDGAGGVHGNRRGVEIELFQSILKI